MSVRWLGGLAVVGGVILGSACTPATRTYPLPIQPDGTLARVLAEVGERPSGSLSVERIEGGQRVVTLQLSQLPPPERIAPGLHAFVVWLQDPRGRAMNVGTLHYDRAAHSGNLLATTDLSAFTVRVTGERDGRTSAPSGILLAERRVVPN